MKIENSNFATKQKETQIVHKLVVICIMMSRQMSIENAFSMFKYDENEKRKKNREKPLKLVSNTLRIHQSVSLCI